MTTQLADLLRKSIALKQLENPTRTKGQLTVSEMQSTDIHAIAAALAAPFAAEDIHWKPKAFAGNRALAIPYLNARAVMDRLDEVLGIDAWEDRYEFLAGGSAVCSLQLQLGEHVVTKQDVGGPSEQPDEGDRRKAAFSDGLKRAAVKFGVGRYLYALPKQWCDYDPQKKQFVKCPQLPASALPAKSMPASSAECEPDFKARLLDFEGRLVAAGLCQPGECFRHVQTEAAKAALPANMDVWNNAERANALGWVRQFETACRKAKGKN
jgi:hypothetical protein